MPTICLSMIVKNESPTIARCLNSILPLIDAWCIVDTGSTDDTKDVILFTMHDRGIPGGIYHRDWVDFATNRSEALRLARATETDYTLVIDADDWLAEGTVKPENLTADIYAIDIEDAGTRYRRPQIVSNAKPWRYQGVLHEFLACDEPAEMGYLPITMVRGHDGARRRSPDTYKNDAAILENALGVDTDPFMISRYTFYLAQSYRDAGENEKALSAYLARTKLGGWVDEVYISLLSAARLMESLNHSTGGLLNSYHQAIDLIPQRAEAYHGAARLCRRHDSWMSAYQFAKNGMKNATATPDGLFVEPWILDHGLLDEYAIAAYWSGHYRECVDACEILLSEGKLPVGGRGRIIAAANFARRRLVEG